MEWGWGEAHHHFSFGVVTLVVRGTVRVSQEDLAGNWGKGRLFVGGAHHWPVGGIMSWFFWGGAFCFVLFDCFPPGIVVLD